MKKTTKKSPMMKIVSAAAMLAVSASMLGTSTYAWFSMNDTVTATGMSMKAKAEEGLVISNAAAGTYDVTANSTKTSVAELYPGSTADLTNWWHSVSTNPGAANTHQDYVEGVAWTANSGDYGNYIVHDFYIRSSAATVLNVASLDITGVTAEVHDSSALESLSPALRVGIKIAGDTTNNTQNTYIFAPVTGADTTCTIQPGTPNGASPVAYTATSRINPTESTATVNTAITSIPARTSNGTHVEVFVWYEGEDAACKSDNLLAALQQLDVTVTFGYTAST